MLREMSSAEVTEWIAYDRILAREQAAKKPGTNRTGIGGQAWQPG